MATPAGNTPFLNLVSKENSRQDIHVTNVTNYFIDMSKLVHGLVFPVQHAINAELFEGVTAKSTPMEEFDSNLMELDEDNSN